MGPSTHPNGYPPPMNLPAPRTGLVLLAALACRQDPTPEGDPQGDTDAPGSPPPAVDVLACLADRACDAPLVVSHRGHHAEQPENSLAAIREAASVGAHLVEIDIRITADEIPVVLHDATLQRTTTGWGDVTDHTLAELSDLRLLDGDDPEARHIPTLVEALERAADLDLAVYLDIKTARVDLIVADVLATATGDRVLFRAGADRLGPAHEAGLPLLIPYDSADDLPALLERYPDADWVELARPLPDADATQAAVDLGLRVQQDVFVQGDTRYRLTGETDGWLAYFEAGAQMLQTDEPEVLRAAVDGWQATGTWPAADPP